MCYFQIAIPKKAEKADAVECDHHITPPFSYLFTHWISEHKNVCSSTNRPRTSAFNEIWGVHGLSRLVVHYVPTYDNFCIHACVEAFACICSFISRVGPVF